MANGDLINGNGKKGLVAILVQAGLTGVAMGALFFAYFIVTDNNKIISNHINHNTEAMVDLKSSIEKLNENNCKLEETISDLSRSIEIYMK